MSIKSKSAPALPRFVAPKCMTSSIFLSKKDKSKLRRNLNRFYEW